MSRTRISFLLVVFCLALVNVGQAECPYVVLNETDVTQELSKAIHKIIQKGEETKSKNPVKDCEKIAAEILDHYMTLTSSYKLAYAQYRIDHLTKFFKDSEDDKKMKVLMRLSQDMGGKELQQKYLEQQKELEKELERARATRNYQAYEDKRETFKKLETEIENQMTSRYKALLRNMAEHPATGGPFTFVPKIKCASEEVSAEVLPTMITTHNHIRLVNYCIRYNYDYQNYPQEMSRMIFKISDGRAEIWNCDQTFKTEYFPPKGRRPGYLEVDGTANCLGFDVLSGRYLDHTSLYGHNDKDLIFVDRMEKYYVEKGFNKTNPMKTLPQFVEMMGQKAITFDHFYDKNVPSRCKFWTSIKDEYRSRSTYSSQR